MSSLNGPESQNLHLFPNSQEIYGHEDYVDDGYCYFLRLKNCNSKDGIYIPIATPYEQENQL